MFGGKAVVDANHRNPHGIGQDGVAGVTSSGRVHVEPSSMDLEVSGPGLALLRRDDPHRDFALIRAGDALDGTWAGRPGAQLTARPTQALGSGQVSVRLIARRLHCGIKGTALLDVGGRSAVEQVGES
jgi:hypothetical protein